MSKALKAAIEANDADAVRKALKLVKDINRKLPGAKSPLFYACEKGADQVLEVLFAAGAVGETAKSYEGDSPFARAAEAGHRAVMEKLRGLKQASEKAVEHVLLMAAMAGKADLFAFVIERIKPPISAITFRLASGLRQKSLIELLVKNGGDINATEDNSAEKGIAPLHHAAGSGDADQVRVLLDCGADVNIRDALGRTPLITLAGQLEGIEMHNETVAITLENLASGASKLLSGQPPRQSDWAEAVRLLLAAGADAALTDNFGNDAITYCEFEYARSSEKPNARFIKMLREAGAPGSGPTGKLFDALRKKSLSAVRQAIEAGADVNRVCPPPVGVPPLIVCDSEEMVELLLKAGANPNQGGLYRTPLISAAGSGNLAVVKRLVAAGADIHAVELSGEFINNAYQAAEMNRKFEVVDYLKSLGAGLPKSANAKPLEPGVGSWNDFSELLVKTTVEKAANAIAKLIKGRAQLNMYGQSLLPGKQAYVVARPKGMDWCNVFQIAPPRLRFEDAKKTEGFAVELAKACGASVLSIEYSDTSDAASVLRVEPDGKQESDKGWDRETLEELVGAMGDEAPAWAKKQLAQTGEDEPSSTERVVMLAEQEKFVVAAFGFHCEPGRKIVVEVSGHGAESFAGVALVSN